MFASVTLNAIIPKFLFIKFNMILEASLSMRILTVVPSKFHFNYSSSSEDTRNPVTHSI